MAAVAGLEPDKIRQLLQLDLYGTAEIMSEAGVTSRVSLMER